MSPCLVVSLVAAQSEIFIFLHQDRTMCGRITLERVLSVHTVFVTCELICLNNIQSVVYN